MLILLAVLSLTPVQAPSDPAASAGRDVFDAGICGVLGWDLDQAQAAPIFAAVAAADPETAQDQIIARADAGGQAARAEFEAGFAAAKTDRAALARWSDAMAHRCDDLAARHPLMLRHGPQTEQRWAARRAALEGQVAD